jgi:hypothetical protein
MRLTNRQLDSIAFFGMVTIAISFASFMIMISTVGFKENDCDIKYIGTRFYSFSYQLDYAKPKTFRDKGKKWVVMSKDYYDSHMKIEAE